MDYTIRQNAHAVILPAFSTLELSTSVKRFLSDGGCSILVGETREEYVSRHMSEKRQAEESADVMMKFTEQARSYSDNLLIAVDQEIAGICRLHDLVDPFPSKEDIQNISVQEFETISAKIGRGAKELGLNCFLGPILDIVTGINPWLEGRTWSTDPQKISAISSAFIRGIQSGGVAAAAKHFPGYAAIALDPAIDPHAMMRESIEVVETGYIPFEDAIKHNVEIIMTGPATVEALDSDTPASLSKKVIEVLRADLKFQGVILSDDLDSKATLRGQDIYKVAVEALDAGADLLLIADLGNQIPKVVDSIIDAVRKGKLSEGRLCEAARKVRTVAEKYSRSY